MLAWRASTRAEAACSTALLTLGSDNISPSALAHRRQGRAHRHDHRHPVGLPAARLRRVHLRVGQGEPVVVHAADADRVPVLRDRLGHRARDAALHGVLTRLRRDASTCAAWTRSRGTCSTRSWSTSRSRCSTCPPHLRGRRVVPRARLHGARRGCSSRRSSCRSCSARWCRSRCSRSTQVRQLSRARRGGGIYVGAGVLTLVGIFAMRWNVVIGGQLFSKSFLGYTTYKMEFATREGLLPAILLMLLPFGILGGAGASCCRRGEAKSQWRRTRHRVARIVMSGSNVRSPLPHRREAWRDRTRSRRRPSAHRGARA